MDNEELIKVINTMQKITDGLLTQNAKLQEELERLNRDYFLLSGVITITLLLVLYAMW
jgi:CHASE3 domain sensor protein